MVKREEMARSSRADAVAEIEMGLKNDQTVRIYPNAKKDLSKSPYSQGLKLVGGLVGSRSDCSATRQYSKVFGEDQKHWWNQTLDPESKIVHRWNRIFLLSLLISLFVDPLYFFLWKVENIPDNTTASSCIERDYRLSITVTIFRTVADLFYFIYMAMKFRIAYVAPSIFGRGELIIDPKMIARKYMRYAFFIDLAAALPLPQIVLWSIIRSSGAHRDNYALLLIVFVQYIPRLYRIFPLIYQIIQSATFVLNTAWAGAVYNLLLYLIASHVGGSLWYLLTVWRQMTCWELQCSIEDGSSSTRPSCESRFLSCDTVSHPDRQSWANITQVFASCNATNSSISFNFGIFLPALTHGAPTTKFTSKYFYCLWWGLQTFSSYAQAMQTSLYLGETLFCIVIVILGLLMFAQLIGSMTTYLQSASTKLEEYRLKKRDTEEWMRHHRLPAKLSERVRRFVQYKWLVTRGSDEESILQGLPADLRRDIKRHLCSGLVRRVPFFSQIDDQLHDAICDRLVSSLSTEGTYIVREGDPVTEMLFIIRGKLESTTTNGGRAGFFNSIILRPGDFCGEEVLSWSLMPQPIGNLPSSTRTIKALVEVEAFALLAEDLKFVASQFRMLHSKRLQHVIRYYSHHWRAWAACFIQAAWRQFKKRKIARDPSVTGSFNSGTDNDQEEEDTSTNVNPSQSLEDTFLDSEFAASTRKGAPEMCRLQKPDEAVFSTDF